MGTLVFQATLGGAVNIIGPNIANTINFTLPSADGTSGQTWTTNGSGVLAFGTLGIAGGGTGQITATAAFNALAPSQSGQSGKYLTTDGTNTSWGTNPLGTVTSVAATVPSFLSIAGSPITTSGTLAFTLSGTALPTTSGGTGLTSFTSGGVVYASSTSALATGSALTFDGTTVGIGPQGTSGQLVVADAITTVVAANQDRRYRAALKIGSNFYGGEIYGGLNSSGSQTFNIGVYDGTSTSTVSAVFQANNTKFYASGSEALTLTSTSLYTASGINVAFGTSSTSSARLTVAGVSNTGYTSYLANGTGTAYNLWRMTNTGGDLRIGIESATAVGILTGTTNYSSSIGTLTATDLQFGTNSTVRATIDSAGNLGLGVAPSAWDTLTALQVKNASLAAFGNSTYLYSNAYYQTAIGNRYIADGFATRYTQGSGKHIWETAPSSTANATAAFTEAMTLDASGALIVGTTTAQGEKATFQSSTISSANIGIVQIRSTKAADSGDCLLAIVKQANDDTTSQVFVRFGINGYAQGCGQINANGASQAAFGSFSDYRLKENIESLPSQLSNIMALRPVEFDYKNGSGHQVGFIAQEMEQVYPDAIGVGEDEMLTITGWSKTEARLVKAIQEQQAIIESLKARLDAANL